MVPILSNHVVNCGGTQILLGVIFSSMYVCNSLSRHFVVRIGLIDSSCLDEYVFLEIVFATEALIHSFLLLLLTCGQRSTDFRSLPEDNMVGSVLIR